MKPQLLALLPMSLMACGCSMTLPVQGAVLGSAETLTGTATGQMNGSGTLTLVTSKGATCRGNFVYVTERNGEGLFRCDDGRSGPFRIVSNGTSGTGYGDFSGQRFTFRFG
jgi:hypothetical protein